MSENKLEKEIVDKKEVTEVKNIVELLLKMDAGEIKMPSMTYKIFCKKVGIELPFECTALEPETFDELQSSGLKIENGSLKDLDNFKMKTNIILASCKTFKDKELLKHFKSPTPRELLRKMLLAGEINDLYNKICELNGYSESNSEKDKRIEEKIKKLIKTDGEINLMYLMFRYKGIMPSVFYKFKHGEKRIVKAFMYQEMDERIEEIKSFGKGL